MSRGVVMRVVKDTRPGREGYLVEPVFGEDNQYLAKLPPGEGIITTFKYSRQVRTNNHRWVVMKFVLENLPERFEAELGGKTPEYFDRWLKFKVGYTEEVVVDGRVHVSVKSASFDECPDEQEYRDNYHEPAMAAMAWIMGYPTVSELIEASRAWVSVKDT